MTLDAHAAEKEGRLGAGRCERRNEMRRGGGIRPVVEGDRDLAGGVDAADDRRPMAEGEAKGDQGSDSALAASDGATTVVRSPKTAR
ncbi:hypothetical protein DLREEDagr8_28570 [Dongia sp. agr-C8]